MPLLPASPTESRHCPQRAPASRSSHVPGSRAAVGGRHPPPWRAATARLTAAPTACRVWCGCPTMKCSARPMTWYVQGWRLVYFFLFRSGGRGGWLASWYSAGELRFAAPCLFGGARYRGGCRARSPAVRSRLYLGVHSHTSVPPPSCSLPPAPHPADAFGLFSSPVLHCLVRPSHVFAL